jgi:hypothetical protein
LATNSHVTPLFFDLSTTKNIPKPTSNSNGTFTYEVSSNPNIISSQSVDNNNDLNLTLTSVGLTSINSVLTIRAVQNSTSTHASNSLTYPVTDCINIANEGTMLYTTPTDGLVGGIVTYQQSARLNAFIMGPGTLQGFSFQHFGGYSPATTQVAYTMTVSTGVGNSFRQRTITFTLSSIGATKDGSMTFIPFSPDFFTASPSLLVGSIAYSGDDVQNVNNGDIVFVTLTTDRRDGGGVMCTAYPVPSGQQPFVHLIGSLVTNINVSPQTFGGSSRRTNSYVIGSGSGPVTIFDSSLREIGAGVNGIRFYQIVLNGINFTTIPTTSAPAKLTIQINTNTGYYWEIKVTCNRNPDYSMIVPLNMPVPGDEYSESYAVNNNSSIFVTSVQQGDIGVPQNVSNRGVNLINLVNPQTNSFNVGATASYPAISREGATVSVSPTTQLVFATPFDTRIVVTLNSDSIAMMGGPTPACLFNGTS